MYLKCIEIQGFKSFAKKTVLDFKNGTTAIVGPNGSGKSNVADAVRWVLGEQKVKSLRGYKMEDVIFAGTENRNPLSFAYVAITFENSDRQLAVDYSEVKVARKLYRSGESEYLLNDAPVRLKDVRELFYDTGIGKEGYSIIGQGRIDMILQGKSEERRELFDEACGIVKYKKRKTAALRKLENERLNLERVSDIVNELEKRLGPLKRQSDTANSFINYKNELKSLDINLFLHESGRLKEKIKECAQKEEIARKELEQANGDLARIKAEHEKAALKLSELDSEIEDIKEKISQKNIIRETLLGQINVLNEQINSARESESFYYQRKEELSASIAAAKKEKAEAEKNQAENSARLEKTAEERSSLQDELIGIRSRIAQTEEESEGLKEALIENIRKKGETSAKAERLKARFEQLEKRKAELESSVKDYRENAEKQKERIAALTDEFEQQKEKIEALEAEIEKKNASLAAAQKEAELLNRQLSGLKLDEAKAKTRLESVRNITERYEGYSGAIKEVMALKPKKKGIIGVTADIIRVPEKYETAIETALGASIQNIVTDNENTARQAIEYLKANKLGRATFLPLNAIKSRGGFPNKDALNEAGVLGTASSLVSVEAQYLDLNEYLLGRILVVDSIDNALHIARKYRYSFIMVTLEGELLSRGGALSGGAYKNRSNLLGRRREIEELEKEICDCEEKIKETSGRLTASSVLQKNISAGLKELEETAQEERILLNTLQINLSRAQADEKELAEGFENARSESEKALEEEAGIKTQTAAFSEELKENAAEAEAIKLKAGQLEEALAAEKQNEARLVSSANELDMEISRLKEQLSFLVSSVIRAENNIAKLESDLNAQISSAQNSAAAAKEKLDEIDEINADAARAEKEAAALSIKLAVLEDERKTAKEEGGGFTSRHDELTEKISSLDKEIFRLGQLCEKYEDQFNSEADYIWQEYELTYNGSLEFRKDDTGSPAEMRARIGALKAEIRSLGTINVSAIDEYKEVKERFEFLSLQRNDILKAEEDILKIIKDLDKQMKAQFKAEFAKISDEFSRVFRIMFGGGKGTVFLEDESDILNSDIIINAQPPGKKLQNMMQLSGGEKALTAIAVLFAIQNLKPSPFCILDEIEAALDDSNITKFANYLTLLSGKIQFIVITHRKGTMEVCDRLYGITMQEKGVSSLVSVSLKEAEQTTDET